MLDSEADNSSAAAMPSGHPLRRALCRSSIGLIAITLCLVAMHVVGTGQLPFLHRENVWSVAVYEGPTPFDLQPVELSLTPQLTANDVHDIDAMFVADPFALHVDGQWVMFCELLNTTTNQGDIGYASSDDGVNWRYRQIVLDEPFHLSYPAVFRWDGQYYLLPESSENGDVRLYQATEFPTSWRHRADLVKGPDMADPTLFRYDDHWWMFLGTAGTHDGLLLYHADQLLGPWMAHPQNPLIVRDPNVARPGGPVFTYHGQLYRLAQDCHPKYGNALRAVPILELSRTVYREDVSASRLVLQHGSAVWNAAGMHHCDLHELPDGRWRALVDGHRKEWMWRW